jgi:hypothetical protein
MNPQTSGEHHRGGIRAWVRSHKTASAIAAAGGGLLVLLVVRSRSASSSGSTSATSPDTATSSGTGTPATYAGSGDYTGAYDAAMTGVQDALAQFDFSNGGGSTGGGGKKANPNAHSWTDKGQSWSAAQLAAALGIPLSALHASDPSGAKGLANPNVPLAKGASFTYLQTPAQSAAGKKPRNVRLKRPITVRKTPVRA